MKKIIIAVFSFFLLIALFASFAVATFAEEQNIEVIVGQKFEWNDNSETKESQSAWRKCKATSPDGLWKYQFYVFSKDLYTDMMHAGSIDSFGVSYAPGTTGVGYARVGKFGINFHPAETADAVKTFLFPSGGTVTVETTVARLSEWTTGTGTPTSIAFYLDDQLVYPTSGDYLTLTSTVVQNISFDLDVAKNQRLYIHIGSVNGDPADDSVDMYNSITYKAVNDEVVDLKSEGQITFSNLTNTVSVTLGGGGDTVDSDSQGTVSVPLPQREEDSSNTGLIIGIVVGAVVVVAAVAIVIVKKRK